MPSFFNQPYIMDNILPANIPPNKCPLCLKPYEGKRRPVTYHISYKPEKTIVACNICNWYEYLARKHPGKVPSYGKKFRKRLIRIKELSPQYEYKYRKKYEVITFDRFGNEIKRDKKYRIESIK